MAPVPQRHPRPRSQFLITAPLYMQVRDIILERIRSEYWQVGVAIPTEFELASDFKVSVGTIRKAMDELTRLAIISRHQGRGTFVSVHQTPVSSGLLDRIRHDDGSRIDWEAPTIHAENARPTTRENMVLCLEGEDVIRSIWVHSSRSRAQCYQACSFASGRFPGAVDTLKKLRDISEIYPLSNTMCGRVDAQISTASLSVEQALTLNLEVGTPVLRVERIVYDIDDMAIEVSDCLIYLQGQHFWSAHRLSGEEMVRGGSRGSQQLEVPKGSVRNTAVD